MTGMRWVLAAALLGGCHVLFELDPAPFTEVTGHLLEASVVNNAGHEPVRDDAPVAVDLLVGRAVFDDGSDTVVTFEPDGSFRFERPPNTTYELSILAAGRPVEIRHRVDDLKLTVTSLGRTERQGMTQTTLVEPPGPLEVTDLFPTLTSTGIWASAGGVAAAVDWRNATFVGPASLLSGTDHDALYFHVSAGVPPPPAAQYYAIARMSAVFPEMMDGTKLTMPPLDPVLPARCATLRGDIPAEVARLTAAYANRNGVRPLGATGIIQAYVDLSLGSLGSQLIAFSAAGQDTALTAGLRMDYPDPFPGTTLAASMLIALDHVIEYPGAAPLRHQVQSLHAVPVPAGTCPTIEFISEASTAVDWQVGETVLTGENGVVVIDRSARVPVRFALAGRADVISVALIEIIASSGLTVLGPRVATMRAVEPSFAFDPALLESGHSYAFTYSVAFGIPGAADGDMRTAVYPTGLVQGISPVFQIQ